MTKLYIAIAFVSLLSFSCISATSVKAPDDPSAANLFTEKQLSENISFYKAEVYHLYPVDQNRSTYLPKSQRNQVRAYGVIGYSNNEKVFYFLGKTFQKIITRSGSLRTLAQIVIKPITKGGNEATLLLANDLYHNRFSNAFDHYKKKLDLEVVAVITDLKTGTYYGIIDPHAYGIDIKVKGEKSKKHRSYYSLLEIETLDYSAEIERYKAAVNNYSRTYKPNCIFPKGILKEKWILSSLSRATSLDDVATLKSISTTIGPSISDQAFADREQEIGFDLEYSEALKGSKKDWESFYHKYKNRRGGNACLYVTASRLNIRSQPSTKGKKTGVLRKGDAVCSIEAKSGWTRFDRGWVSSKYLSTATGNNSGYSEKVHEIYKKIDRYDYNQARADNSIESYDRYMREHPKGQHAKEARLAMKMRHRDLALEQGTMESLETFLNRYPEDKLDKNGNIDPVVKRLQEMYRDKSDQDNDFQRWLISSYALRPNPQDAAGVAKRFSLEQLEKEYHQRAFIKEAHAGLIKNEIITRYRNAGGFDSFISAFNYSQDKSDLKAAQKLASNDAQRKTLESTIFTFINDPLKIFDISSKGQTITKEADNAEVDAVLFNTIQKRKNLKNFFKVEIRKDPIIKLKYNTCYMKVRFDLSLVYTYTMEKMFFGLDFSQDQSKKISKTVEFFLSPENNYAKEEVIDFGSVIQGGKSNLGFIFTASNKLKSANISFEILDSKTMP